MKRASFAFVVIAALALPSLAANKKPAPAKQTGPKPVSVDLSKEKTGAAPQAFLPVVGNWTIQQDGKDKVITVDGRAWKKGNPAEGMIENARKIYGSRHEEFIDNVKAFAYFPYAVAGAVDDFQNGEIYIRFKLISGSLDQCAGILFNLKPNGDYLTVRFNQKESNLVLWTFKNGKRSFVKRAPDDIPLDMGEWYTMKIAVHGTQLQGYLNDKLLLEYTLPEPVSGRVGLWSKTDSVTEFADYKVLKQ
jgi:hypothetical protein